VKILWYKKGIRKSRLEVYKHLRNTKSLDITGVSGDY